MPELPEVEVLARHLRPLLRGQDHPRCRVRRAKVLTPTSAREFTELPAQNSRPGAPRKISAVRTASKNSRRNRYIARPSRHDRTDVSRRAKTNRCRNTRRWSSIWAGGKFHLRGHALFWPADAGFVGGWKNWTGAAGRNFTPEVFAQRTETFAAADQGEAARPVARGRRGQYLCQRSACFAPAFRRAAAANRLTPAQVEKLWRAIREVLSGGD